MRKIPRIDHALKDHFYPYRDFFAGESVMTQKYVYRGVTYEKQDNQNITVKNDRIEKVYRGAAYFKLPNIKQRITAHVYRGVEFAA
jgi:hypothetical protein